MTILKSRAVAAMLEPTKAAAHLVARQSRSDFERQRQDANNNFRNFGIGAIVAVVVSIVVTIAIMVTITVMLVKRRNRRRAANAVTTAAGTYSYGGDGGGGGYNGPYTSIPGGASNAPPAYTNNMYAPPQGGVDAGHGQQYKSTGAGADPAVGVEPYRPTGQVPV